MDYDRVRGTYQRFRPYLVLAFPVVAAVLMYVATKTSGWWVVVWFVLAVAAAVTALVLGWRYRQAQPGGWWAWLGFLWACGLLLLVGVSMLAVLTGGLVGVEAALDSAPAHMVRLIGVLDRLDVAVPIGAAGALAALGGIGVLVPLGRSPLSDHIREEIGEVIDFLLVLVGAMSLAVLLGVVAKTDPHLVLAGAVAGGLVPLSVFALAVPLVVGLALRRVWQLLSTEAGAGEAHDADDEAGEPASGCR